MGLGFYVTNSDRRVRVGVIFTNHIPVLNVTFFPHFHISVEERRQENSSILKII